MTARHVLAIDQGTTGSTCLLLDETEALARAALEAMAYGTHDVLTVIRAPCVAPEGEHSAPFRVDGGATANDWLMQFQADVLGVAVERPAMVETTALAWARDGVGA